MKIINKTTLLLAALLFLPVCSFASSLMINVDNINSNIGGVLVMLFKSPKAFDSQSINQAKSIIIQRAEQGKMTFTFSNLSPGKYAYLIIHDKSSDNLFSQKWHNTNRYGFAFSNNTSPEKEPSFHQAAIQVANGKNTSSATLFYLKGSDKR